MKDKIVYGIKNNGEVTKYWWIHRSTHFVTLANGTKEKLIKESWRYDGFYSNFYFALGEIKVVLNKIKQEHEEIVNRANKNLELYCGVKC